jgi:hypothetical protein
MTTEQLKAKLVNDIVSKLYFDLDLLFHILLDMNRHNRITSSGAIIARFNVD